MKTKLVRLGLVAGAVLLALTPAACDSKFKLPEQNTHLVSIEKTLLPEGCPARVAIWNVRDPQDIPDLEAKGFNLFFLGIRADPGDGGTDGGVYCGADGGSISVSGVPSKDIDFSVLCPDEQDRRIKAFTDVLGPCSQVILDVNPWLRRQWLKGFNQQWQYCPGLEGSTGMEAFVYRWGGTAPDAGAASLPADKVYGFTLADDVPVTPLGIDCKLPDGGAGQPDEALWIVRHFYRMIHGQEPTEPRTYNHDLAPGKKAIVTMGFRHEPNYLRREAYAGGGYADGGGPHFNIRTTFNVPPNFFVPGDSWDVMGMYFYPYDSVYSPPDYDVHMDKLYQDIMWMFPDAGSRMPLLQAASGGDDLLFEPDLRLQYRKMLQHGVVNDNIAALGYFTSSWREDTKSILYDTGTRRANDGNLYYRSAGIVNSFHQDRVIAPRPEDGGTN